MLVLESFNPLFFFWGLGKATPEWSGRAFLNLVSPFKGKCLFIFSVSFAQDPFLGLGARVLYVVASAIGGTLKWDVFFF